MGGEIHNPGKVSIRRSGGIRGWYDVDKVEQPDRGGRRGPRAILPEPGVPSRGYVRPRWAVPACPHPTGEDPGPIRSGPSAVLQHPPGGGRGELGGGPEAELGLDPPAIGLDGVDAQVQLVGDLGRGPPPADQPEHLQLAIREGFVGAPVGPSPRPTAARRSRSDSGPLRYILPASTHRIASTIRPVGSCLLI